MKRISYVIALAAALTAAGLVIVPTAQAQGVCVDSVTAGGWVPDPEAGADEFANFGLNAREEIQGEVTELTGQLNFVDADEDCHVVGFELLSYAEGGDVLNCEDTGECRTLEYAVTVTEAGVPLVPVGELVAVVIVCDNGESHNDPPDSFSIAVFDVTIEIIDGVPTEVRTPVENCSAAGCLAGGDVQVHEIGGPNCP